MTALPPDFEARLRAHMEGIREFQNSKDLSHSQNLMFAETVGIFELMLSNPELSEGIGRAWEAREEMRRVQLSAGQATVIWRRVSSTLSEAVEVAKEIGRVTPEMKGCAEDLCTFLKHNEQVLSEPSPKVKWMDQLEKASQALRTSTRAARAQFHGTPHPDSHHTAHYASLSSQWRKPISPREFVEALNTICLNWKDMPVPITPAAPRPLMA